MPYSVKLSPIPEVSINTITTGSIWDPPPRGRSNPSNPTYTVTIDTNKGRSLVFSNVADPPASGTLWVSNQTGDVFRSGAIGQFPPTDSTLTFFVFPVDPPHAPNGQPPMSWTQADLDNMVQLFPLGTIAVPTWLQAIFASVFAFGTVPLTVTLMTAALTLPAAPSSGTLNVQVTGTIRIRRFFWKLTKSFAFAMTVSLTPSADPVDIYRVLACSVVSPGPSLGIPGIGLPSWVQDYAAGWIAGLIRSMIEDQTNSTIYPSVRNALAGIGGILGPQMMTQTAVISMTSISILPSGILLAAAIADLFGPAIMPIPAPLPPTTVPNIIGDDVPKAQQILKDANLFMYWKDEIPDQNVVVPTVVAQTPSAGTSVPEGFWVTCKVVKPWSGPGG